MCFIGTSATTVASLFSAIACCAEEAAGSAPFGVACVELCGWGVGGVSARARAAVDCTAYLGTWYPDSLRAGWMLLRWRGPRGLNLDL
eukprot:SAG31_NODE_3506_length_4187_cov_1.703767_2_plen_88_part_00